ncbi:MAG: cobalamin-dependent protein [Prolixibacteraceae bacterium]|jgi:methanogenic corrinoid protein MtbC1|nr:cobalamin-dependent protein [Prolixibacteraceae bacterium]
MFENINKYDFTEFQNNLVSGDYEKCSEFVKSIVANEVDIKQLYDDILKRSLYNIGEMWETGKITVSTEHLASAIVETILSEIYFKIITQNKSNKTAVLACTENEFHQIGIKMVSDIFEKNGWHVSFSGTNTTSEYLIEQIESLHPDILAISLSIPFNFPTLEKMIVEIREKYPDLYILVGGQAFLHGGLDRLQKFSKLIYKANLDDLDEYLKQEVTEKL